jgi:hypothetical protein
LVDNLELLEELENKVTEQLNNWYKNILYLGP